jgi:hypothetical protein
VSKIPDRQRRRFVLRSLGKRILLRGGSGVGKDTSKNQPTEYARATAPSLRPSAELRDLVDKFFQFTDAPEANSQPILTEWIRQALLDAMERERIPFNSENEARWVARWLQHGVPVSEGKHTRLMFARMPEHYDVTEYDPIRHGV